MTEIYRTQISEVGPLATAFLGEGMLITFGSNAPEELREFCFIVAPSLTVAPIEVGQTLWIDQQAFPITAVGAVAQRNLDSLGHVTIKLDAANEAGLAGAIHVAPAEAAPALQIGSTLVIEAA